jgi:hypothetical protein
VRAGYVGASDTPGVITPYVEREREKKIVHDCVGTESEKKTLDDGDNWTDWKLIRKPLRMSWP